MWLVLLLDSYVYVCMCLAADEIEFEVGTDSRTHKLIARRLVKLPDGTVSFESISEERLLGKVDCEPRVVSGTLGAGEGGGKGSRVSRERERERERDCLMSLCVYYGKVVEGVWVKGGVSC